MTLETLKNILQHYGLSPNKTYGQNFLMDETVLEDMIDVAGVGPDDIVVEVGPGIGNLTERLLKRASHVVSIEKDPQFLQVLQMLSKEFPNFSYHLNDVLTLNLADVLKEYSSYKVVANIPYYITGKIIQLFIRAEHRPESLTLLMQKEVARNLTAKPGSLNLLAISVQLYADVKLISIVPGFKFFPEPKVDSAVVHVTLHKEPRYEIGDEKKLFQVLRACFSGKRKQLHNTLINNLHLEKKDVEGVLAELKIDTTIRPQQLMIEQWIELTKKLPL
ncbi:MAG: 16S rRNA (adenine(1518)-N(6)/adenine(1519)-N(6))-dimethyltransferase RsmA [bacterium]|nr:16S rRNA (adenine(1518)-N(6)/adenine(1519)-N(6))-dimethyltransferase RsmA [bacterium]